MLCTYKNVLIFIHLPTKFLIHRLRKILHLMLQIVLIFSAFAILWFLKKILERLEQICGYLQKLELTSSENHIYIKSMQNSLRNIEVLDSQAKKAASHLVD